MTETLLWDEILAPGPDDADWGDVLRRARGARRRRLTSASLAVATIFCLGAAAAYAFGHPIVDFSSAPKGPRTVVNDFGSLQVGAPEGMAPGVLPQEARRITTVTIDGKEHVLWVAPTKKGGFCEQWSNLIGGCRADRHDPLAKRIDVSAMYVSNKAGPRLGVLAGSFFQSAAAKLELAYADGTTDEIPFVWVTTPIDAGFYLFRVPDAHRVDGHRPKAVRLYDDAGNLLASEPVRDQGANVPRFENISWPATRPSRCRSRRSGRSDASCSTSARTTVLASACGSRRAGPAVPVSGRIKPAAARAQAARALRPLRSDSASRGQRRTSLSAARWGATSLESRRASRTAIVLA